jgi:hypothetical protein
MRSISAAATRSPQRTGNAIDAQLYIYFVEKLYRDGRLEKPFALACAMKYVLTQETTPYDWARLFCVSEARDVSADEVRNLALTATPKELKSLFLHNRQPAKWLPLLFDARSPLSPGSALWVARKLDELICYRYTTRFASSNCGCSM